MFITDLEKYPLDKKVRVLLKNLNGEEIFNKVKNNLIIETDNIYIFLQLLLREIFWCKLKTTSNFKIIVGYDFYVYVYCDYIPLNIIEHYKKFNLFIEKL